VTRDQARHPIAHPADCACGKHEDTTAFVASLWRATDTSLRADPQRWPTRRTDDLPSRCNRPFQRAADAADAAHAPDPDAVVLGANEAVVAETLRAAGCPLTRSEVESRSGLTFAQVRRSLGHLRDAGRVTMSGWGGGRGRGNYARWRLCDDSPTAAPTPSPSANAGTAK
jgi:hypothetical protein